MRLEALIATPFGIGCGNCEKKPTPIRNQRECRNHIKRCWSKDDTRNASRLFRNAEQEASSLSATNVSEYLFNGTFTIVVCTNCHGQWEKRKSARTHYQRNSPGCHNNTLSNVSCRMTLCGRYIPINEISATAEAMATRRPVVAPIQVNNGATLRSYHDVLEKIRPFIRDDEKAAAYVDFFAPMIEGGLEANIRRILVQMGYNKANPPPADPLVEYLQSLAIVWLEDFAPIQIPKVPGNIRATILVFPGQAVDDEKYHTTFTLRMKLDALVDELLPLLRFAWGSNRFLWARDENDSHHLQSALVPRILYQLLLEEPASYSEDTLVMSFVKGRCFKLGSDDELRMLACAETGSRAASTLHVLRAGVLSYLWHLSGPDLRMHAKDMATSARECTVVNLLSPFIHRLRSLNREKPRVYEHFVRENLDIVSSGLTFKASHWMSIIPRTCRFMKDRLDRLLEDETWKTFLEVPTVCVSGLNSAELTLSIPSSNWLPPKLKPDYSLVVLQELISAAESALHGHAGGATRHEEIFRLHPSECVFQNGAIYFQSQTVKKFNCLQNYKRLIDHKLSDEEGRMILLVRFIVLQIYPLSASDVFLPSPGSNREYTMMDAVKDIFELPRTPSALQIRHLYASIADLAFPDDANDQSTAQKLAAEKFGHSKTTHQQSYRLEAFGGQENFYSRWHKVLGAAECSMGKDEPVLVPPEALSVALQSMCGSSAKWRTQGQEEMVFHAANCRNRHSHVSLPCGVGKSMSWLCPALACLTYGLKPPRMLIVLPTKFLAHQKRAEAEAKMGFHSSRVGLVLGTDVGDSGHPYFAKEVEDDIVLLFTTIDAISRVNAARGIDAFEGFDIIIIDEIHCALQDDNFRRVYDVLPELHKAAVPIMTLSGSLHPSLAGSFHSGYLRLAKDDFLSSMKVIREGDPLGSDFSLTVEAISQPVAEAFRLVKKFILRHPRQAAHVICDTVDNCNTIGRWLGASKISHRCVTGDPSSDDQELAANAWLNSSYAVLVGTTCTVVGVENPDCRLIVVVGLLYSAANLVQAIGRLRPNQRGPDAQVAVLYKQKTSDELHTMEEAYRSNQLVLDSKKIVSEESKFHHEAGFSSPKLHSLLEDRSRCYLQSLRSVFGGDTGLRCGRCSVCKPSSIRQLADETANVEAQLESTRTIGVQHLKDLFEKCLVCSQRVCNGESCLPSGRCYQCHGPHQRAQCKAKLSPVLEGYSCFFCFDQWNRIGAHKKEDCPLQRRLKRLLLQVYWTQHKQTGDLHAFVAQSCSSVYSLYRILSGWDRKTMGNGRSALRIVKAVHVSDSHKDSPLLPPNALDTKYIRHPEPSIVTNDTVQQARNYYKWITQSITQFSQSQRKFLEGSFYSKILGNPFRVQPEKGCVINIDLGPSCGVVQVGMVGDSEVTRSVVALSKACARHKGNTSRKGDRGTMYAMGYRKGNEGRQYELTKDPAVKRQMPKVGTAMSRFMKMEYQSVYNNMRRALNDENNAKLPLDVMGEGQDAFSAFFLTRGFANSSHYDSSDKSLSFGMWVEDEIGNAKDWYFVLPSVMVAGQYGVIIRLSHGVVISWDGTRVRHCTSECTKSNTNQVTGFMVGVQ